MKGTNESEVKGKFRYQQDSKRYHRFQIETEDGVVRTIYIPKDLKPMPKIIMLDYVGKDEK